MNDKQLFEIWAPPESIWSPWAKPVVFTVSTFASPEAPPLTPPDVSAWRDSVRDSALIVDLPGARSVSYGLALAQIGFRPVPLFNAVDSSSSVVEVKSIRLALEAGAEPLQQARLSAEAPPAFLLDSNRLSGSPQPGDFDNRWVVFPQDFPSGALLKARGIRRVTVLRATYLQRDLVWMLTVWKRAGLEIYDTELVEGAEVSGAPVVESYTPAPVTSFRLMRSAFVFFLLATLGLRRSAAGGFGSAVPIPSRSG
ncbi:MAG: hypothetical protein IPK19_39765 [Chloroflexi bacterium]|nr:hypothetical protein [Chloroflexota bacterium]